MNIFAKNLDSIRSKFNDGKYIKVKCCDSSGVDGIDDSIIPTIIEGAPYLMDTRSIELGGNDDITTVKIYKIEAEFGNRPNTDNVVVIGQFIGEFSIDRFVKEEIQPSYILDMEDLYG